MCVPHSCQPPSSISCALFHISCAWIHSSSTKWWFVLRNYYRICCCCKVTWFALYLCQECMLTAVWQSKMDYSNSRRFFSSGIFLQTWNLAWCFFSRYWKELKYLISCICLQRLTLYRTSVIWLVFITIHVEAMMNCCFNVFIRLLRYVLWASTHLSSKDYLDGLIDRIEHNGMCQSTSQPFLNISLLLTWL